ncbi:hypothetical protein CANARDRAFT_21931 [[Candida] arabinofermentans NRRL YB-2248]|uniref:Uncharacterized protein n=1 Tax=[Candida] arabinofermentans NRRL YB-2248 TaxID=983967 RepID=A0A1E4T5F3_9ASCO|nr:hypothetical protein CANARDRAFT_21931 [[Candida] arabinofermentans NRRL YB-2248]
MTVSANDWKLNFSSGGRVLPNGQAISPDGKYSIVLFKSQIRVYSLATRQSIRSIKLDIDLSNLIDVSISDNHGSLIYLFTSSSKVLVINWKEKLVNPIVDSFDLQIDSATYGSPVKFIKFDESEDNFYFLTGKSTSSSQNQKVPHTRYVMKLSRDSDATELATVKNVVMHAISIDRSKLAFLTNKNQLVYVGIYGDEQVVIDKDVSFPFRTAVTSLAVANDDNGIIALGTISGIIQVIYVADKDKPQRLLKWHLDQVKALTFNHDDTYLLSSGLERVLVFWQLETDKQQFLPRLNGTVNKIIIDKRNEDLYGIVTSINSENDLEYLVLSSVDLTSRLNVSGVRPKFATSIHTIEKDKKRLLKQDPQLDSETISKIKHDYTSSFEVHSLSKQLYIPYGAFLQAYDPIKNEQSFVTSTAPTIQAGKVKSETLIQDSSIELFSFTNDGKWMCTFDKLVTPELDNLLSEKDIKYSLKFWKYVENSNSKNTETGHWSLSTKIIDPHGSGVPIVSIIPSPSSYQDGLAFLTADNKGGLRLWRPRIPKEIYNKIAKDTSNKKLQQTAWTLRKVRNGSGRFETNSVSTAWSQDSSIIALGQETSITLIDVNSFVDLQDVQLPSLAGSRIRLLRILDNNLIVLTKNRLVSFDLLTFQSNKLAVKVNTPQGGKNLMCVDDERNLICFAAIYYTNTYDLKTRVFIFSPTELQPVFIADHDAAITSVRYSTAHSSFILIDTDAKIGILSSVAGDNKFIEDDEELDKAFEMSTLLSNAKQISSIKRAGDDGADEMETDGDELTHKLLNASLFEPVLENLEGLPIEALFDRVMRII